MYIGSIERCGPLDFGVSRFDVHEDGRVLALAPAEVYAGKGFREDKQLGADECWLDAEGQTTRITKRFVTWNECIGSPCCSTGSFSWPMNSR